MLCRLRAWRTAAFGRYHSRHFGWLSTWLAAEDSETITYGRPHRLALKTPPYCSAQRRMLRCRVLETSCRVLPSRGRPGGPGMRRSRVERRLPKWVSV